MRETYRLLMLGFPVVALLNAWWFGRDLQDFVKRTPRIASTADIENMKAAVSRQMYAALAQIGLLAVGPIAYAVGLAKGALEPSDIVFIILPSAAVLLTGCGFA